MVAEVLVGRPIKILIVFDMTRRLPELRLFPFVDAYMAPRFSDECLKIGSGFYCGMGSLVAVVTIKQDFHKMTIYIFMHHLLMLLFDMQCHLSPDGQSVLFMFCIMGHTDRS